MTHVVVEKNPEIEKKLVLKKSALAAEISHLLIF